jgi:hypothetical protein
MSLEAPRPLLLCILLPEKFGVKFVCLVFHNEKPREIKAKPWNTSWITLAHLEHKSRATCKKSNGRNNLGALDR